MLESKLLEASEANEIDECFRLICSFSTLYGRFIERFETLCKKNEDIYVFYIKICKMNELEQPSTRRKNTIYYENKI